MNWRLNYEAMLQKQDQNLRVIEGLLCRINTLENKSIINIDYIDDN
jgi:hypothetical protein